MSDLNAERATLAACLWSRTARDEARNHITGADFSEPAHEAIWDAMSHLDRSKEPVDPNTLLSSLASNRRAMEILPTLVTNPAIPDNVGRYATGIRDSATKRRAANLLMRASQSLDADGATGLSVVTDTIQRLTEIRDSGNTGDVESITLGELMEKRDDPFDWLIPGLLEKRDRFMLTGEEGLGKSHLLRQIAVLANAGLHPFDTSTKIRPLRVHIIDCENSERQIKRRSRGLFDFAEKWGTRGAGQVNILTSGRIDILRDRDLARLHQELEATQPEIVIIGPIYKLVPRAIQTDDEAAPVLAALDTIREKFDCALLIEAHAGNAIGEGGKRNLRPRGSSALLGWPEFGYGMRSVASGCADLVPWRGDREERGWPQRVRHDNHRIRWIPVDATPIEEAWA